MPTYNDYKQQLESIEKVEGLSNESQNILNRLETLLQNMPNKYIRESLKAPLSELVDLPNRKNRVDLSDLFNKLNQHQLIASSSADIETIDQLSTTLKTLMEEIDFHYQENLRHAQNISSDSLNDAATLQTDAKNAIASRFKNAFNFVSGVTLKATDVAQKKTHELSAASEKIAHAVIDTGQKVVAEKKEQFGLTQFNKELTAFKNQINALNTPETQSLYEEYSLFLNHTFIKQAILARKNGTPYEVQEARAIELMTVAKEEIKTKYLSLLSEKLIALEKYNKDNVNEDDVLNIDSPYEANQSKDHDDNKKSIVKLKKQLLSNDNSMDDVFKISKRIQQLSDNLQHQLTYKLNQDIKASIRLKESLLESNLQVLQGLEQSVSDITFPSDEQVNSLSLESFKQQFIDVSHKKQRIKALANKHKTQLTLLKRMNDINHNPALITDFLNDTTHKELTKNALEQLIRQTINNVEASTPLEQLIHYLNIANMPEEKIYDLVTQAKERDVLLALMTYEQLTSDEKQSLINEFIENTPDVQTSVLEKKIAALECIWEKVKTEQTHGSEGLIFWTQDFAIEMQKVISKHSDKNEKNQLTSSILKIKDNDTLFSPIFLWALTTHDPTYKKESQKLNAAINSRHGKYYQIILTQAYERAIPSKYRQADNDINSEETSKTHVDKLPVLAHPFLSGNYFDKSNKSFALPNILAIPENDIPKLANAFTTIKAHFDEEIKDYINGDKRNDALRKAEWHVYKILLSPTKAHDVKIKEIKKIVSRMLKPSLAERLITFLFKTVNALTNYDNYKDKLLHGNNFFKDRKTPIYQENINKINQNIDASQHLEDEDEVSHRPTRNQ